MIGRPSRAPRPFVAIFRTLQDRADRWPSLVRALAPRLSPKVLCGRAGTIAHPSFPTGVRTVGGQNPSSLEAQQLPEVSVNTSISPTAVLRFQLPRCKLAHWATSKPSRRSPFPPIPHRIDPSPPAHQCPFTGHSRHAIRSAMQPCDQPRSFA